MDTNNTSPNAIKVRAVQCDSYDQPSVDDAVQQLLAELGGIENIVPYGSNVLLKANLVRDMHPDQAGTTHPTVLTALANIIADRCGATVVVGDSSGGMYNREYMGAVYKKCQMTYVRDNSPATLNDDYQHSQCKINGKVLYSTSIINAFVNADVVINVGKLKMHSFTGYSGAIKNLFGLVAGLVKVELHSRYAYLDTFADVLLDIEQFAQHKVVLHVLDAVVGMEGAGPTNGTPRHIGKLMASSNPYMLDYVANSLYCDPWTQPILVKACQRGLIDRSLSELDFDMEGWKKQYIEDFRVVKVVSDKAFLRMPNWISRPLRNNITQRVSIRKTCRACSKCIKHCPANAITLVKGKAKIDQSKCIRCYCCQELCPFDAVALHKPLLYRIVRGLSHSKNGKTKKH